MDDSVFAHLELFNFATFQFACRKHFAVIGEFVLLQFLSICIELWYFGKFCAMH